MKTIFAKVLSLTVVAALVPAAFAASLGDPAAPLHISTWVKGKPVDLATLKGKQVAVVEFWATWCPPCRASIPHLTELQKKFTNVVFIGVSDEDAATVKKFVDKMGDQMDYTVAVDDSEQTGTGYMKAYGIDGIPNAFVVDKEGKVIWQGHPMGALGEVLAQVEAGKYNMATAKKTAELESKIKEYYGMAVNDEKDSKLPKLAGEIALLEKEIGDIPADQQFNAAQVIKMVHFRKAMMAYQEAVADGKGEAELDKLGEQLQTNAPAGFKYAEFKEETAVRMLFNEYFRAAATGVNTNVLNALGEKVAAVKTSDVRLINDMAWMILTDKKFQVHDMALALKLAKKAVSQSEGQEPYVLDTYARALFENGDTAGALAQEKQALALVKDDNDRKEYEASLKTYQDKATSK